MDKEMLDELFGTISNYQGIDMDMDGNNNFRVWLYIIPFDSLGICNDYILYKSLGRGGDLPL